MSLRFPAIAACLAIAAAIGPMAAPPAGAAEAPPGSKNFNSPGGVPNYFSNEAAPFVGSPNPRPAPVQPAPVIATPAVVAPAPVQAAPAPARPAPAVTSRGALPSQPLIKTVTTVTTSRDRQGRTVRTVTVKRYTVAAASARSRAPAPVRTARAEPRSAKSKSAAAKARPVSTGGKRAGRGSAG
jgi:hypothetical protein